ncbi:MAG: transposase [bacterium]|nr:transposase [bacterium]MCP4965696.1 transposase [bacterium]
MANLLRIAGSLKQGTVRASNLIRTLGGTTSTSTGSAMRDLGRIDKTLYQLGYINDPDYRRRIHTQLNRHESRHALARAVFHGDKGQLRQRYREGQEDQPSALSLVVNTITLWNTVYTQAALDHLRQTRHEINPDIERLTPLGRDHINLRGRYNITTNNRNGQLPPLRA